MTNLLQRNTSMTLNGSPTPDTNRRRFLMFGAGAASAAAAAPVIAAAPAAVITEPVANPESQGYQETQHVRDYYATTRI